MNPDDVERVLLSSASEDWIGLYEAIWELNSLFPKETLGRKYDTATNALLNLHNKGWIRFAKASPPKTGKPIAAIGAQEVAEMLSNPISWYPDHDGAAVVFSCTDAGMEKYMSGGR